MGRPLKTAKQNPDMTNPTSTGPAGYVVDSGYSTTLAPAYIGVVGGFTGYAGPSILANANIEYSPGLYADGDSFIIRQKGKSKFLVGNVASMPNPTSWDGNLANIQYGVCYLTDNNSNTAIQSGEMTINATDAASNIISLAKVTDDYGVDFNGDGYWLSANTANATPQPGSTNGGLYPVVQVNDPT